MLIINKSYFWRLAINVPTATPDPKPNANIPILTAEGISAQIANDEAVANTKSRSAIPTRALFDFTIFSLSFLNSFYP
jgi:hypothetical protein